MSQDRKQIIHLVDQALWRAVDQDGESGLSLYLEANTVMSSEAAGAQ